MADVNIVSRLPRVVVQRISEIGAIRRIIPYGAPPNFYIYADKSDDISVNDQIEYLPQGSYGKFVSVRNKKVTPVNFPPEITTKIITEISPVISIIVPAYYNVTIETSTLTFSGKAASFTWKLLKLPLATGSILLSGKSLGLVKSKTLSLAKANLTFSGKSLSGALSKKLQLSTGSSAFSGISQTLNKGGRIILPAKGTIALSGKSAGLAVGRKLAFSKQDISVVGRSVTLTSGSLRKITATKKDILLSGQAIPDLPAAGNLFTASFGSSVSPFTQKILSTTTPYYTLSNATVVTGFFSGAARIVADSGTGIVNPLLSYQLSGLIPGQQYKVDVVFSNNSGIAIVTADTDQNTFNDAGNFNQLNRIMTTNSSGTLTLVFIASSVNYLRVGLAGGSGSVDIASVTLTRSFAGNLLSGKFWRTDGRGMFSDFLSSYDDRTSTNWRGFLGSVVSDTSNVTQFDNALQARAALIGQAAQKEGIQAVIIWDLCGSEFRHTTQYIGAPDELAVWAPEMLQTVGGVTIVKRYIDKLKSYGLRVGVCLRIQTIPRGTTLPTIPAAGIYNLYPFVKTNNPLHQRMMVAYESPPGTWGWYDWESAHPDDGAGQLNVSTSQDKLDARQRVIDRITYCKNTWGISIFYVDTTVWEYGDPIETIGFWDVIQAAHPDVMICPENETWDAYNYTTPYGEFRIGDLSPGGGGFFPDNPQSQMLLSIAQGPQDYYHYSRDNLQKQYLARKITPLAFWADPLGVARIRDIRGNVPWQTSVAWDPNNAGSGIYTLSNSNLTATVSGQDSVYNTIRALGPKLSGKWHVEFELIIVASGAHFGLISETDSLDIWIGATRSIGVYNNDVWYQGNQYFTLSPGSISNGVRGVIEVDLTLATPMFWVAFGAGGNWNNNSSANPATGVGGYGIETLNGGPIYPAFNGFRIGNGCTIKAKLVDFIRSPSSGFSPWGI